MSICAGLALGLDDNLYIASYGTDELVVLSRDGLSEIRRVDMPVQVGLTGFDGIALIAGSENTVMSTAPDARAAIIDPLGAVVAPATKLGLSEAPLLGGAPMLPDAVLTLCGNGHAWLYRGLRRDLLRLRARRRRQGRVRVPDPAVRGRMEHVSMDMSSKHS